MGKRSSLARLSESLNPVADYEVAPHRYLYDAACPEAFPTTYKEVVDAAPYKAGEVVYVVYGDGFRKAIIVYVGCSKDYYGDWREQYTVFPETKNGKWSKLYYEAHPGFIQRGYRRAGMAPEMPEGV